MGAWTEITDYTVPSNTTSVVLNTFGTITKDDFIKIVVTNVNNSSSGNAVNIFPNSETTTTDYHRQFLEGSGTGVSAGRDNINRGFFTSGSSTSSNVIYLKLSENDRFNIFTNGNASSASNLINYFNYCTSSNKTFSSGITSLTFTASVTNGLGTGSRIQIYRLDAEKVADITTTANATQVDISSLSIGKDSEYLLVSDAKASTGTNFGLFVNDNTTATNYYVQFIRGDGSSASAGRVNSALISSTQANVSSIIYSHIKLSEIGAYTSQSYEIENSGLSSVRLTNWFVSSTAENITSITKLNVVGGTNAIASGSRFILYKLK